MSKNKNKNKNNNKIESTNKNMNFEKQSPKNIVSSVKKEKATKIQIQEDRRVLSQRSARNLNVSNKNHVNNKIGANTGMTGGIGTIGASGTLGQISSVTLNKNRFITINKN